MRPLTSALKRLSTKEQAKVAIDDIVTAIDIIYKEHKEGIIPKDNLTKMVDQFEFIKDEIQRAAGLGWTGVFHFRKIFEDVRTFQLSCEQTSATARNQAFGSSRRSLRSITYIATPVSLDVGDDGDSDSDSDSESLQTRPRSIPREKIGPSCQNNEVGFDDKFLLPGSFQSPR